MELFKIPCKAETAEGARQATFAQHQRAKVSWVQDDLDSIRRSVEEKQARAAENPVLYADKLREYDGTLRRIQDLYYTDDHPALGVIEALALNGDARLVDRDRVCAIWRSGDEWIIFGAV
jgi:hypothetical protein